MAAAKEQQEGEVEVVEGHEQPEVGVPVAPGVAPAQKHPGKVSTRDLLCMLTWESLVAYASESFDELPYQRRISSTKVCLVGQILPIFILGANTSIVKLLSRQHMVCRDS